jgi:hypothetical protein
MILVLLACNSFSQDTSFVKKYKFWNKVKIGTSLFTQQLELYSSRMRSLDSHAVYVPNVNSTLNLSLGIHWLSLAYSFKIPTNYFNADSFGTTKYHNLSLESFYKWWGFSGFLRTYDGFFSPDKFYKHPEKRPDVSFVNAGINLYYFGNHNKFSFRAAFSQDRRQIKSAGGFILGSEASYKRLQGERSLILKDKDYTTYFDQYRGLKFVEFGILDLRPGYAYDFVFEKGKYYICPMLLVGGGASIYHYKTDSLNDYTIALHLETDFRISAGYDVEKFFMNFTFDANRNANYLSRTTILSHTSFSLSFTAGCRFGKKKEEAPKKKRKKD